jgi:hypothetical protein
MRVDTHGQTAETLVNPGNTGAKVTSRAAWTAAMEAAEAPADRAKFSSGLGGFAGQVVDTSVDTALLRMQETGSVFADNDRRLMGLRGVGAEDRARFAEIVQDAAQTGAYADPVTYIQSLPPEDIDVLRKVHSLAETTGVTQTDTEGAINLLLPPSVHVDIDDNAIVEIGAARGIVFPPPNAPQAVKDAWAETTKGMTFKERMLAEIPFMVATIAANFEVDENGRAIGLRDPNDPDYVNVFSRSTEDWYGLIDELIAGARALEDKAPHYGEQADMLVLFRDNLATEHAAA